MSLKEEHEEKKPTITNSQKSSMEILSELFSTFDAEPPLIVKTETKDNDEEEDSPKKRKKSKKKHKHKEKKHKKKSKKKKRSDSSSPGSGNESEIDLAKILIKKEKDIADRIKIEGTGLSLDISSFKSEKKDIKNERSTTPTGEPKSTKSKKRKREEGEISDSGSEKDKYVNKCKHKSSKKKSRSRSKEKKKKHEDKHTDQTSKYSSSDKNRSKHSRDLDFYKESDSHRSDVRSRDRSRGRSRSRGKSSDRSRPKSRDRFRAKSRDRSRPNIKDRLGERSRDSNRDHRSRSRDRHKEKDSKRKDNSFYKDSRDEEYDKERNRSRDRDHDRSEKWFMKDRYRGYDDDRRTRSRRSRSKSKESTSAIDKKKLLEIARRNAITMMKSGSLPGALSLGPQAQEKVIAAIKSGGKTIEELTDFCKTLSKKEELGELSSLSEKEESDTDEPFHHPFQLKEKPTSITMNIKNSVPLPLKSQTERSTELRMQFPVSSGQQHRKTESNWVPVSPPAPAKPPELPKAAPPLPVEPVPPILPIEAPPPLPPEPPTVPAPPCAPPGPQVFPAPTLEPSVDIGSIVSQRLTAMRKLQENPNDVQALTQMYKSNKEMQSWAQSKQQFGQFTGSTGAQLLTPAELSSGYQAWAKKDQLQSAAPVSGGMGMHLLQKMGWKPGEGLGKEKTGALEPLLLEVKLDKKGLVATEEQSGKAKKKQKGQQPTVKSLQGKHPVSLLGEYASKRKLGAPQYIIDFECGPDHKKNFLFKVILNGVEYKHNVAKNNKKEAKAASATVACQQLGLL